MKLPDHVLVSKALSAFLCAATQAQKDYRFYEEQKKKAEDEIQDYQHKLELDDCGYKERAKIATALQDALQRRRTAKDACELLAPFVEWCASTSTDCNGFKTLNKLRELLGQCRKKEEWTAKRTYRFRVLKEPDIQHKEDKG